MFSFDDIFRYSDGHPRVLFDKNLPVIFSRAIVDLSQKSVAGAILVPLCLLVVGVSTGFVVKCTVLFLVLLFGVLLGASGRILTIIRLQKDPENATGATLFAFSIASSVMALSWGISVACFLAVFGPTFPFFLILIMSAGICAGAVTNFSQWRNLAYVYLILMNGPSIFLGIVIGTVDMLSVMSAFALFLAYMLVQVKYRNIEYWNGLIKGYLFEAQAELLKDSNSKLATKMVEQRESQEALQISRSKMRELFDNSNDGILIHDMEGQILDLNRRLLEMFQIGRNQALKISLLREFSAPDNQFDDLRSLFKNVAIGKDVDFEWHAKRKKKEHFWVHVNMRKVLWNDKEIIFTSVRDINEQKQAVFERDAAKNSLVKSEGYLEAILEHSSMPMFCKSTTGKYIKVNKEFAVFAKAETYEIEGRKDNDIFSSEVASFLCERDDDVLLGKDAFEIEGTINSEAETTTLLIYKFPLLDSNGAVYAIGGMCTDITGVKTMYFEAKRANEIKAEFLANMSHELRTPMHGILSFARLAAKRIDSLSTEKLLSYLEMITKSGGQLLELLDDLLDLSTLDAGQMNYDKEEGNISADLNDVVNEFNGVVEEKNISLLYSSGIIETAELLEKLCYDRTRIRQVLRNLLSNAVKFSHENQEIFVNIETDVLLAGGVESKSVRITVADQGVGVPADELDIIFEKFVQGRKTKDGAGGTGLGLSICKQIVEDHRGKIWAEQNPDGGTKVVFLLPLVEELVSA